MICGLTVLFYDHCNPGCVYIILVHVDLIDFAIVYAVLKICDYFG